MFKGGRYYMSRKWIQVIGLALLIVSLSGCGKPLEEQIDSGLSLTEMVFKNEPKAFTETVGDFQLFLPTGYKIEETEDEVNALILKGKQSYLLFVNKIEGTDSQLHYDLMKNDTSKEILDVRTYEEDKVFGFSAIIQHTENTYELVVSLGGVKMTTISDEKKIEENLTDMLEIVRSVKLKNEK